jgi:hypothetical protein
MLLFLLLLINPEVVLGLCVLYASIIVAAYILIFCQYLVFVLGVPIGLMYAIWIILVVFFINELFETRYQNRIRFVTLGCLLIPIAGIVVKIITFPHKLE